MAVLNCPRGSDCQLPSESCGPSCEGSSTMTLVKEFQDINPALLKEQQYISKTGSWLIWSGPCIQWHPNEPAHFVLPGCINRRFGRCWQSSPSEKLLSILKIAHNAAIASSFATSAFITLQWIFLSRNSICRKKNVVRHWSVLKYYRHKTYWKGILTDSKILFNTSFLIF